MYRPLLSLFFQTTNILPPTLKLISNKVLVADLIKKHKRKLYLCGPGSIPGLGVICGLSLLLVLVLASRVFLRVLRFSSLLKN